VGASKRHFAVGTALYEEIHPVADLIANSVGWLIQQRNNDGTWGGQDALDKFITTTHTVMALLGVGFSPDSEVISSAINYLVTLDKEKNLTFFYRSGALLNIGKYSSIVKEDVEYLWKYRKRIGVHKDYPTFFFWLKLLKFADPIIDLDFTKKEVLKWIIEEWNSDECWYGRTSLTSMALALIYDERFKDKETILDASRLFLETNFTDEGNNKGYFNPNIVDDSFTVYNLCERDFLNKKENSSLREFVKKAVNRLISKAKENKYWESQPPFGGSVGSRLYPTAVVLRALLSFFTREVTLFTVQISSTLIDKRVIDYNQLRNEATIINSFWGKPNPKSDGDFCFVLMPFKPPQLTEIYKRYIKEPIQRHTNIKCMRADDIYKPTLIMSDIWNKINDAKFIIADLTDKNPNVFYELGMAHTLGKEVILVSQKEEDIPFDLRGVRTIIYEDSLTGYDYLSEQIFKYIKELNLLM
jgi:hypothetical protein